MACEIGIFWGQSQHNPEKRLLIGRSNDGRCALHDPLVVAIAEDALQSA